MKQLDTALLRQLSVEAAAAPRRRKNYNLHSVGEDPIQRMLNAFEPRTYIRPHRHHGKWELFAILTGRASVLTFDDAGRVQERTDLAAEGGTRVVEIAAGAWHTVVSHAPQTVMFEVKAGPYTPTAPEDFASWAPPEGDPAAAALEQWFQTAAPGDTPPHAGRS